jgi:hypothetical protein
MATPARTLIGMTFPSGRILSPAAAEAAARAIQTPSEVDLFEAQRASSPSVRAFLETEEWAAIRDRIMGDGKPPLGVPKDLTALSRLLRWTADSVYSEKVLPPEVRAAYLHAAAEVDAFARRMDRPADELAAKREAA